MSRKLPANAPSPAEQQAAMKHVAEATKQAWKVPGVPKDMKLIPIKKVGVIGAGTMGGGIAMNFVNVGIPVTILEIKQEFLDRGIAVIKKNYDITASRGRITTDDVAKRMSLISGTTNYADLGDVDMVIEAVYESMEVKKEVFKKLDAVIKPGAILGTNTSALDIDEIASVTKRPEFVIGLHFFSPANVMKLLEIVVAYKTSLQVTATSMHIAQVINKVAVLCKVCPGFVGNRILYTRQREAFKLVFEGALPWQIDNVLYSFGFPMGPFAMADLVGLDVGWNPATSRGETMRERLCEAGRKGQKTGSGWYEYDEKRKGRPSKLVEEMIVKFNKEKGAPPPRKFSDQEILERLLFPMINEAAKILEEKVAIRPSDIDVIYINGYGFPGVRGGPCFYADQIGLARVLARLQEWTTPSTPEFTPSALLVKMVREGKKFADLGDVQGWEKPMPPRGQVGASL
ncbi:3-hydroxyacyl-CoA dehydrogenase [Gonapodya prolifera JEL478]|uniref:3-hydroxyacyl-CoA dehydrogenase n=1 Tax=Gonapodya prolifera (strain JEL478) TaxID=1344416 RepID=A0A139AKC0_GONPJ|nr:3-hydroxyacyl-CoA dehydrogenase [Gonapodya prolifera JEL478]|eukprot:KXS17231.1 3-hydroxyacyl-CoA dehydrogenase [Gonapodya prolifera JEL478]